MRRLQKGVSRTGILVIIKFESELSLCGNPTAISSVHSEMGAHVSNALKSKIVLGRYIDLALLLNTHPEVED